jgi:hypothetical protein
VDSSCLKDTKQGASATGAGKVFQILVVCGKKLFVVICGNSTLGFLRRNLKVSNQDTKTAAYKTLVHPTIEYCSSVWSPHTKDAINKIEMVQRRAARYVTNRYRNTSSVTSMLGDLEWDTLETRRKKIALIHSCMESRIP